jgi:hypothetical protein
MARLGSIEKGGFYPFPVEHLPALASLFAPAAGGRIIDPCAGEGVALNRLANDWQLTPYANELDVTRAEVCRDRFGPTQAVEGDLYQLRAPGGGFVAGWINPPYVWDKSKKTRRELHMLKHSIKWIQPGGYALWCVYQHHVTPKAAEFLAKYCDQVDIWRTPDLHLDTYVHVVVVARIGRPPKNQAAFQQQILEAAKTPRMLKLQREPLYTFPAPRQLRRSFYFAPKVLTPEIVESLLPDYGIHRTAAIQQAIAPEPENSAEHPLSQPSNGQLALILAAGLFNGLIVNDNDGTPIAIRGKVFHEEALEEETSTGDTEETSTDKEVYRTRPRTILTAITPTGAIKRLDDDSAVVGFIQDHKTQLLAYMDTHFKPAYQFQPDSAIVALINQVRVKGQFELWETQKHVIAAAYEGLKHKRGMYLVGEPGIGKTPMGATLALLMQRHAKQGQVSVVMAPPHLTPKWKRETRQIAARAGIKHHIEIVRRAEDVVPFMQQAEHWPAADLKMLIIPREMAKLTEGWETAAVWKPVYTPLWEPGKRPDHVPADTPRLKKTLQPTCPHCGTTVMQEKNGELVVATKRYLNKSKRVCHACRQPLWQDKRSFSKPKKGQKYPTKNPRVPLAELLARRYPGRILLFMPDEVHELKSSRSIQGLAMMQLANSARYMVGLTGTLYGGKASSLYGLEFTVNDRVRRKYPWGGQGLNAWVKRMGVLERVVEYKPEYDETGAYSGKRTIKHQPGEAPGSSPEMVREIIDHTLFVGLLDSGRNMPDFEEIPVPIPMTNTMQTRYDKSKEVLGAYLMQCMMDGDNTFMGAYLQGMLSWPTAAFRDNMFIHNQKMPMLDENGEETFYRKPYKVHTLEAVKDDILPKEAWLLETVAAELEAGRNVGIFCRQTGTRDIQPRLERLITEHIPLAKPWIMYGSKIPAEKREERLEAELKRGVNVFICNPRLVQTGLDLVDFPTLIFYEVEYSLYVMGQASRRAWRIIQDRACKVYYPHYTDCMEERAVQLVGMKQAAANLLAGQGTGEGLSAFSGGPGGNELLSALADNFNASGDEAPVDMAGLFGKVSTEVDVATSTWLMGIAANPDAFASPAPTPGQPPAAEPVKEAAPETDRLAPPENFFNLPARETPAKPAKTTAPVDLSRTPDDDDAPIPVEDWPVKEAVQLTLF